MPNLVTRQLVLAAGCFFLLSATACTNSSSKPGSEGTTISKFAADERAPGMWQESLMRRESEDGDVRYTIQVPYTYDGETKVPLIFCLHFGGPVSPWFGRQILTGLVDPALGDLDAIIVAPDSLNGRWNTPENEQAIQDLYTEITETYAIDTDRTLLTGFSMGGHGTFHIAAKHPDKFGVAIPVAGNPSDAAKSADWNKVALYVIHSRADEVVAIEPTESFVKALKEQGVPVEFAVIDDLTHFQTGRYVPHLREAAKWVQEQWSQ
ncbi:MAG: prolyl oligopeptidase family serine peptidase [Pirellulaceae bacterium]